MSVATAVARWWLKRRILKEVREIRKEASMQAILWRLVRSAVTTAIGGWWATKQNDPRWLAGIPIVHTAFKWLRDKYPTNGVINALPF